MRSSALSASALLTVALALPPTVGLAQADDSLQQGELLVTGVSITPTAAQGSSFQSLNPDLPTRPDFVAGQAVTTAVSPDGKLLLALTSGFNTNLGPDGSRIAAESNEYVFVYDISGGAPRKLQALQVPNTFAGLAWQPNGQKFYVSGGQDDNVHVFARQGGGWAEDGAPIALEHGAGVGLLVGPMTAGLAVNPSGTRLLVANHYNDSVSWVDLANRAKIAELDLRPGKSDPAQAGVAGGEYPFWVAFKSNAKAYVSSQRDREIVVLAANGDALSVQSRIAIDGQPNKMILNRAGTFLYVAVDNSDSIAVIDTAADQIVEEVNTTAPRSVFHNLGRFKGSNPNSLALAPDDSTLFVTNGGTNSVAVIQLGQARVKREDDEEEEAMAAEEDESEDKRGRRSEVIGLIPTGWYPNSVSLNRAGTMLYVVNGKSTAGPNPDGCRDRLTGSLAECAGANQYIWQLQKAGFLSLPMPSPRELAQLTRQVGANNRFESERDRDRSIMNRLRARIDHVIYIIKENRTYDQVLGDLEIGNGDPDLTVFPEPISPNHHQLARRFVTLDNFYVSGGVSGDGWSWSTAARTNDHTEKSVPVSYAGRGFAYEWEGPNRNINTGFATIEERKAANPYTPDDEDILPGTQNIASTDGRFGEAGEGHIWDAALRRGRTVRNYGCFIDLWRYDVPNTDPAYIPLSRTPFADNLRVAYAGNEALLSITNPYYRGYDMRYPDYWKFKEWEREFDDFVKNRNLPNLQIMALPHDHFGSFGAAIDGVNTVETQMADNDYALGQLVEKVAHSPYKDNTLIFVIEDDAQDGPDHVDAHRSIAYVVGPYVKQGALVSEHYTTVNMMRTIEDILGIEPLGLSDGLAEPMAEVFDLDQREWNYTAIVPDVLRTTQLPLPVRTAENSLALSKEGLAFAKPKRDAEYWEAQMRSQDFRVMDSLHTAHFNRVLWQGLKGEDVPYPSVRHGRDLRADRQRLLERFRNDML